MKRIILTVGLIVVLIASLFVLTGCGVKDGEGGGEKDSAKTQEIVYNASLYTIKMDSPVTKNDAGEEVPVYSFTDERPEAVQDLLGGENVYFTGGKVTGSLSTTSFTYHTGTAYKEEFGEVTPSFQGFYDFIKSDIYTGTIKNYEEVKIGDRTALKWEFRVGSGNGDLYGYRYIVDIGNLYERGYLNLDVVVADGSSENAEAVFADSEVTNLLSSIRIEAPTE